MNEEPTSKKEDEIYCPECGKNIKKDFALCPYCKKDLSKKELDGWQKTAEVGKAMQNIGCLLTKFITIPIILIVIFLVMCGRR